MIHSKWHFLQRSEQGVYYYRRTIPKKLRPILDNKWEIKKSLGTKNKKQAIVRHNRLNLQAEEIFYNASKGTNSMNQLEIAKKKKLREKDEQAIRHEGEQVAILSGIVKTLRDEPLTLEDGTPFEYITLTLNEEENKLSRSDGSEVSPIDILTALAYADSVGIKPLIDDESKFIPFKGRAEVKWIDSTPEQIEINKRNRMAALKERGLRPSEFKAIVESYSAVEKPVFTGNSEEKLIPIKFSEMSEKYLSMSELSPKTEKSYKSKLNMFIDVHGDLMSTEITRIQITEFRNILLMLPPKAKAKYSDKSLKDIAKLNIENTLSAGTVNTYITRLSTLFNWAVDESYMAANMTPTRKVKSASKSGDSGKAFTTEDLQKYFKDAPVHKERITEGNKLEMFWLPLIALYSGLRLEEVAELQVGDLREIEDNRTGKLVWCFDINRDGFSKTVKNTPSIRYVAVHSELIKFGLLDHLKERKKNKFNTLWNLTPKKDGGRYGALFGKRHSTYLRNTVGIKESTKVFHSFRHTAIKAMREAPDVKVDYMKALVGHGLEGTAGKDYFSRLGVSVVKATVEEIKYPRLNLSHLYVSN